MLKKQKRMREEKERARSEAPKRPKTNRSETGAKKGAVIMWKTLEHRGVLFPPEYEPHGVPLVYDGQEVKLLPHEEEIAGFFAVMKDSDYATKPVFVKELHGWFQGGFEERPARVHHGLLQV